MLRLLCTADLHIGRYSTSGDDNVPRYPVIDIWDRLVELAISGSCRALLIAGDFFDSRAAQYENRNRVKAGLERLRAHRIAIFAVAGNHDYQALPDFCRAYPGLLHLFPADTWETVHLDGIAITGRSFAGESHRTALLDGLREPESVDGTIALMHADVNAARSPYAPVSENALRERTGITAWVLGHIHASRLLAGGKALYPGSPQAMDFGETGLHGPYFLDIARGQAVWSEPIPLSPILYSQLDLTLHPGDAVEEHLRSWRATLPDGYQPETICHRLHLTAADTSGFAPANSEAYMACDNDFYRIERITPPPPAVDLPQQARLADASGQAARLLLGLEGAGDPAWQRDAAGLVAAVQTEMQQIRSSRLNLERYGEYAGSLQPQSDEAERAVRRILRNILQAGCGGVA